MKKLVYLIVVIMALGLIIAGCIPTVPPTEQGDLGILTKEANGLHVSGVADGDYIRFSGRDWIMLDNTTGYVILKDASSIPKQTDRIWMTGPFEEYCRAFDYEYKKINARQEWDTNGRIASLNEWLNNTFYNDLGDDKDFVADGSWQIEAGHPDASGDAYIWTGKIALLTKTEFEYFQANGPDLHGTATKAINKYTSDPNMNSGWWLLTPVTKSVYGVYYVQWWGPNLENAGAHNKQVRPTLYLISGLVTSGGDGSNETPFIVVKPPPPIEVEIDVKPGSYPNSINLGSKGVVPVAVLTTDDFDASTIDPNTVSFAGALLVRWVECDVDSDGDLDMLFHFKTQELEELDKDSTEAILTGETWDGIPIKGTDTVNIVPKK